jgi:hypothetical protein
VTLHIIKALIQSCHRDLNIFSKYIVRILNALLTENTNDTELIDLSCETVSFIKAYYFFSVYYLLSSRLSLLYTLLLKMAPHWVWIMNSPMIMKHC